VEKDQRPDRVKLRKKKEEKAQQATILPLSFVVDVCLSNLENQGKPAMPTAHKFFKTPCRLLKIFR